MVLLLAPACGRDAAVPVEQATTPTTAATSAAPAPTTTEAPGSGRPDGTPVLISIRLERWGQDGTAGFEELVVDTLLDPGGWTQAGFEFRFADDAPYRVVVAEGPDARATCGPDDV